ncbi:MAG: histidinol-phosphatase [Treponema sp.]|nr:histidinol-phosphatase [Treponema sp.]
MKTNYHTHTNFCDGKNSAEEMVISAIEKKIDILGFSSHSMYPYASIEHIAPREFENYVASVKYLKEKYSDKIKIFLGFEVEYIRNLVVPKMSDYKKFGADFLIGSVHYVFTEKGRVVVDTSAKELNEGIQMCFAGDAKKMVCEYFLCQREMLLHGDFQIWGHPDVVRKNNQSLKMFSESEDWYIAELKECAKVAKKCGVIAEINTGGIARGYVTDVYPSPIFLKILNEEGVPVTINSDAHNASHIDFAFDDAILSARKAGYTETVYLDEGGIKVQKI